MRSSPGPETRHSTPSFVGWARRWIARVGLSRRPDRLQSVTPALFYLLACQ
jgi:hypothetical protein